MISVTGSPTIGSEERRSYIAYIERQAANASRVRGGNTWWVITDFLDDKRSIEAFAFRQNAPERASDEGAHSCTNPGLRRPVVAST